MDERRPSNVGVGSPLDWIIPVGLTLAALVWVMSHLLGLTADATNDLLRIVVAVFSVAIALLLALLLLTDRAISTADEHAASSEEEHRLSEVSSRARVGR